MSNIFLSKFLSDKYRREIFIVDETKNPTGSHKDHSFGAWLKKIKEQGSKIDLVISSSGNAATSAVYFARQFGLSLHIFFSEKIGAEKLEKIKNFAAGDNLIKIHLATRPKFEAANMAKKNGWLWLRSSTNDDALLGYESLAKEIEEKISEIGSIFIPSSSGTFAVGLYKFLKSKLAFHIIQTTRVNTLVKKFDNDYTTEEKSLADAIVDLIGHRKNEIEKIIKDSGGFGWTINNAEIESARSELKEAGIECSYTSALGLAGFKKALDKKFEIREPIVIIVT
jgi:threonine synthase